MGEPLKEAILWWVDAIETATPGNFSFLIPPPETVYTDAHHRVFWRSSSSGRAFRRYSRIRISLSGFRLVHLSRVSLNSNFSEWPWVLRWLACSNPTTPSARGVTICGLLVQLRAGRVRPPGPGASLALYGSLGPNIPPFPRIEFVASDFSRSDAPSRCCGDEIRPNGCAKTTPRIHLPDMFSAAFYAFETLRISDRNPNSRMNLLVGSCTFQGYEYHIVGVRG